MLAVLVSYDFQFARLVLYIVPAQTIFVRTFLLTAQRAAIEKQFRFFARRVDMHGRDLSDAVRPVPMRQEVRHREIRPPVRLINVETIFLEAVEIDDAEV